MLKERSEALYNEAIQNKDHYAQDNTAKRILTYNIKNEGHIPELTAKEKEKQKTKKDESVVNEMSIKDFFSDYNIKINIIENSLTELDAFNQLIFLKIF